jgi:cell division transport system permease protein
MEAERQRPGRAGGARVDVLGLRHAPGEWSLPLIVAAMAFLAALAAGGAAAATALARHWQEGAAAVLTVQVPEPGAPAADEAQTTRRDRALALLRADPGIAEARALTEGELADLLRPWLGADAERMALPLPAVIAVRLAPDTPDTAALAARLRAAAPGTLVESHGVWTHRLAGLAHSAQALTAFVLALVAAVAAAVTAIATRGALAARRETVEILHGLGATDGTLARRFAGRALRLAGLGGLVGAVLALPVLAALARLAAPFAADGEAPTVLDAAGLAAGIAALPPALIAGLAAMPFAAAGIGLLAAQAAVRAWLRRLP